MPRKVNQSGVSFELFHLQRKRLLLLFFDDEKQEFVVIDYEEVLVMYEIPV